MKIKTCGMILMILSSVIFAPFSYGVDKKSNPCNTQNHRAFDFWLGEWKVTTPEGKNPPSNSSITLLNNGCSIHERYTTAGGYTGNSINFYDKKNNKWNQIWIDNQGTPIFLDGEYKNGAMILSNEFNRITWTLLENQQVNQVWETTTDKGKTWNKIFNGFYTKQ